MTELIAQTPDIFATKGIEYLISAIFMLLLIPFWMGLTRTPAREGLAARMPHWLRLPEGFRLHPGHAWARLMGGRTVRLGWDNFAAHLVGAPDALLLPAPGKQLKAGAQAWSVEVGGQQVPMKSPVDGRVTAVNPEVLVRPSLAARDAYGDGWLVEVEVPRRRRALRRLLTADAARSWLDRAASSLTERLSPKLGPVLADGGEPIMGFARELDPEGWTALAAEAFGTAEGPVED